MTETILIGSLNFVIGASCHLACLHESRLAGLMLELWHLELHLLFFFFSLFLQLIQDI